MKTFVFVSFGVLVVAALAFIGYLAWAFSPRPMERASVLESASHVMSLPKGAKMVGASGANDFTTSHWTLSFRLDEVEPQSSLRELATSCDPPLKAVSPLRYERHQGDENVSLEYLPGNQQYRLESSW